MRTDPGLRRGERIVWAAPFQDPRDGVPCELFVVAGRPGEVRLARCYAPENWQNWASLDVTPEVLDALARAWLASRGGASA